jgi:hypothetical protein
MSIACGNMESVTSHYYISFFLLRCASEQIWFVCLFQCLVSCIIGSQLMGLIDVPAVADELEGCSDGAASDGSLDHLMPVNVASVASVATGGGGDSCTS